MKSYQNIAVQAYCPICNSDVAYKLWDVTSKKAAQHFVLHESERDRHNSLVHVIEELWQGSKCDVLRCSNCDFVYSNPFIAGDGRFYDLAYHRTQYPKWKWEYQITYDALQDVSRGFTYLEIGAGNGAFASTVVPSLTDSTKAFCTEFSDYGRGTIQNLGIECESIDICNINRQEFCGHFDVVCLFQVLEHLDNLDTLFRHLRWLTTDVASVFIAVPNPDRIAYNELHGALLDMPPNHIGRFSKKTFETLCNRWGWKIVEHRIEQSSIFASIKELCLYRFLKNAQQHNSVENRISCIKNSSLRKVSQVIVVAFHALISLPDLLMAKKYRMGGSQWVRLRKSI
jgi:2-polyprenyl-3-methyl-5-hydroxy-6-metoxy-1,4-benzoquinol methylase